MEDNAPKSTTTVTMYPSDLLRHVAKAMNWKDRNISVTVPKITTWRTVLKSVIDALGETDGNVFIFRLPTKEQRDRHRQMALEAVSRYNALQNVANGSAPSAESPKFSPIRTDYDVTTMPLPKPRSKESRQRIMENAKPFDEYREPYIMTLSQTIIEARLPVVKANIAITGIDEDYHDDNPLEALEQAEMLWDTGAHETIISLEFLPPSFIEYLKDPIHDPYRSADGIRVHMEAVIALSNTTLQIGSLVLVVPKRIIPNERVGIIFGQKQCIDRLRYVSVPKAILKAKGEDITDNIWGELQLSEYVDEDGDLHEL